MTDEENLDPDALFKSLGKSFLDKEKLDAEEAAAKRAEDDEIYNLAKGSFGQAFALLEQNSEIDKLEKARRFWAAASVLLNGLTEVTTADPKQAEQIEQPEKEPAEAKANAENLKGQLEEASSAEPPKPTDEERELLNAMQSGRIYSDGEGEEKVYKDRRIPELAKQKRKAEKAAKQASESTSSGVDKLAVPEPEPTVVDDSAKGPEEASSRPSTEPVDKADSVSKPLDDWFKVSDPPAVRPKSRWDKAKQIGKKVLRNLD